MDELLVIAHEATVTGAPVVLRELLRAAKPRIGLAVGMRLLRGGPLAHQLLALADVEHPGASPRAVLVNSVLAAGELAGLAPDVGAVVYVHEEGDALAALDDRLIEGLARPRTRVLCASASGAAELVARGVPEASVGVLPPLVVDRARPTGRRRDEVRAGLGAVAGDLVVLGCGEASWRKGTDLFIETARWLAADRRCVFALVGHQPRGIGRLLEHQARLLGVDAHLRWVGPVLDPTELLAAADVLLMPSRVDPMPLVPLEAALVGTPTVAFDVGGLAALGAAGAAAVVPFPDTVALARAVEAVAADADRRDAVVGAARAWWEERQSPAVVVGRFVDALRSVTTWPAA